MRMTDIDRQDRLLLTGTETTRLQPHLAPFLATPPFGFVNVPR